MVLTQDIRGNPGHHTMRPLYKCLGGLWICHTTPPPWEDTGRLSLTCSEGVDPEARLAMDTVHGNHTTYASNRGLYPRPDWNPRYTLQKRKLLTNLFWGSEVDPEARVAMEFLLCGEEALGESEESDWMGVFHWTPGGGGRREEGGGRREEGGGRREEGGGRREEGGGRREEGGGRREEGGKALLGRRWKEREGGSGIAAATCSLVHTVPKLDLKHYRY